MSKILTKEEFDKQMKEEQELKEHIKSFDDGDIVLEKMPFLFSVYTSYEKYREFMERDQVEVIKDFENKKEE